jgi:hypothetical protein
MTTLQKIVLGVIGLLVLVMGGVMVFHKSATTLGDATVQNYPEWFYGGIQIGPTSNVVNNIITGSCSLTGATSIADRATELLSCPVPKAKIGDAVYAVSTLGGTEGNGAFPIIGAVIARGAVEVTEQNQTGGSATPNDSALQIQYLITR